MIVKAFLMKLIITTLCNKRFCQDVTRSREWPPSHARASVIRVYLRRAEPDRSVCIWKIISIKRQSAVR